jgi:hypothetical protein
MDQPSLPRFQPYVSYHRRDRRVQPGLVVKPDGSALRPLAYCVVAVVHTSTATVST